MKFRKSFLPLACALLGGLLVANLFIWVPKTLAQPDSVFNQLNLLVDLRQMLVTNYVEEPNQRKMVLAAARAMVDSLDDPYTTYFTPEELQNFDSMVRGEFSGIGAEVDIHDGRLRIVSPLEDSPAWKAGILAGDIVLQIDGKPFSNLKPSDLENIIHLLKGEENSKVTLKVRHPTGAEADITIIRGHIQVHTVKGVRRDDNQKWSYMLDPEHRIGYIRLTQFSTDSAQEMTAAVEQLNKEGMKGLILDLRFNPGGLLDAARAISNLFLPAGATIVSEHGRVVHNTVFTAGPNALFLDGPMVVLVNESSASAAEIVSGALSDNHRAHIVGTRSFGKGSVQQVMRLDPDPNAPEGDMSEGAAKVTVAYYYLPSGRNIHRRTDKEDWGVDPSPGCYVPMNPDQIKKMIEVRNEFDVLRHHNTDSEPKAVTAQWIDKTLADPQLAAGFKAVVGKLTTNQWPKQVGLADSAHAIAMAAKRDNLERNKTLLLKSVSDIDTQIARIDRGDDLTKTDHTGIDLYAPTTQPATQP